MWDALADTNRRAILGLLLDGPQPVGELAEACGLSQPGASKHLRVLREAGLVDCERRATWVYYWVKPEALRQLSALLEVAAPAAV